MPDNVDLVIIGAGPGGYVAAIRAAQLGKKVVLVEKEKVGGICLHKGCIPSKTFLRSAELFHDINRSSEFGIDIGEIALNFLKVQERKQKVIMQLHKGIEHLLKKNNVITVSGIGRILGPSIFSPQPGTVSVEVKDGEPQIFVPENVIIATGSYPRSLPGLEVDGKYILNSDHALELTELPQSIIIVGGGVIGIEWASLLSDFGVEVTIVEAENRILPLEDEEISKEMGRLFKKRKIKVITGAKVLPETFAVAANKISINIEQNGQVTIIDAEKMFLSVGRKPNIEDIGLQNTSIKVENNTIQVNEFMQTAEKHIYAIGDVVEGYQLAHVASHEGIIAVDHLAGNEVHSLQRQHVPRCIYSRPEVASIGLSEREAEEQGYISKVGKFSLRGIGKSLVAGSVDGFAKIIVDSKTNDLLGIHMIGAHATELISEGALAMVLNATTWEISHTIHPHPTMSEVWLEASLDVDGQAIHG